MKEYLMILFILIFAAVGCSQTTWFPGRVVWDQHDYMSVLHTSIDTTDLEFQVWQSEYPDTLFTIIGVVSAPDTQLVLLDTNAVYFPELYTGVNRYVYLIAHWISENANSAPSDTTPGHFFPVDRPRKGEGTDIYDIPISEN